MASFRQTRNALMLAHSEDLIDEEEFFFLYDINKSKNLDFPYWKYKNFDLEEWSDDECLSDFRFYKADIYRLFDAMRIPAQITTYNGSLFDGLEAFCTFLKRFAYP